AEAIEKIDIGGPSLLRAAAKNHHDVTVVANPAVYSEVLDDMQSGNGAVSDALRRRLTVEVFRLTAAYDHAIAEYLSGQSGDAGFPIP
ncbi:MAG TPA: bifunctional phosphoribosylaminoimidazolecarboxamide formyltransferase/IMP cyclohydrolase, partial [Verrucomicrobiales bacterium]|nr:bifunctional phosphoribosylaminoimidazolecarboxamide formyltransferase/IMP cyclohydrolase [Verrucomicrobiales bacterium]